MFDHKGSVLLSDTTYMYYLSSNIHYCRYRKKCLFALVFLLSLRSMDILRNQMEMMIQSLLHNYLLHIQHTLCCLVGLEMSLVGIQCSLNFLWAETFIFDSKFVVHFAKFKLRNQYQILNFFDSHPEIRNNSTLQNPSIHP